MTNTQERVEPFGWESDEKEPRIASASVEGGRVTLQLKGSALEGTSVSFDARRLEFLADATDEQLAQVSVPPHGDGLDFPANNVYIAALGLIEVVTGLRSLTAAQRRGGEKGGSASSEAKRAAVRANGAKGGRPKGSKNKPKE